MTWLAKNYTFYIYVKTKGNAEIYHPINIQILNDCKLDQIFINPILPGNQEQLPSSYKLINSFPVLIINKTAKKTISVDISKRISNIFT